jgi:hypothetical protein
MGKSITSWKQGLVLWYFTSELAMENEVSLVTMMTGKEIGY